MKTDGRRFMILSALSLAYETLYKALLYIDSCIAFRKENARVLDLITPYEIKMGIYKD